MADWSIRASEDLTCAAHAPGSGPEVEALTRRRLETPLRARSGPGVRLVTAPPGAGKTTLLTQVAAGSACPVVWYRAVPEDRSERAMVHALHRVLGPLLTRPPPDPSCLDDLLAAIALHPPPPVLLIMDDLQEIAGTGAEHHLEQFLHHRPPTIRIVLGTRRPLAFNTPRMLVSGELLELDGDDLRFRTWEVEGLFRNVYRQPLSPEASAMLTRRLGGWAAGMQLFHLSVKDRSRAEREVAVAELTGRCTLIRSYLARNVLDGLDDERRDFLMRTSLLHVLTGSLCDALLARTGSDAVLRELEQVHFFTTSPDEGLTFRYHQVLRSHLEVMLAEELAPRELQRLQRAAGALLERAGYLREALREFAHAGDWGSVARLIQHSRSGLATDEDEVWDSQTCTQLAHDDPWLALAQARRLFRRGAISEAVAAFRVVEALFDDPEARRRCASERTAAALWLPSGPVANELPVDAPHTALADIRLVTRTVRAPEPGAASRARVDLATGLALALSGRFDEAQHALLQVSAASATDSWQRLGAGLCSTLLDGGELTAPEQSRPMEEVALGAQVAAYPWLARLANGLQACVVLALTGERWRRDACRELIQACRRDDDQWGELILLTCGAVASLRICDERAGQTGLAEAAALAAVVGAPVLALWIDVLDEARTASRATDEPAQQSWRLQRAADDLGVTGLGEVRAAARALVRPPPPQTASPGPGRPSTAVAVHCLGGFRIEVAGRRVDLSPLRPRPRSLLMLLAICHRREVHRERLVEQLWPDVPLHLGTRRLQVAVSSVRQLLAGAGLGEHTVIRRDDAYRLDLAGAEVDTVLFEERTRRLTRLLRTERGDGAIDDLMAALDLYAGELLPEVGAAEWALPERDRLRQLAAAGLLEVGRACLHRRRHDTGVNAAQRALELDPYHDAAWLLLAELHESRGDRTAAAVTRARYARVCDRLDVRAPPVLDRHPETAQPPGQTI